MLSSTDPGHAATMMAVVTTGNGGYDKLVYQAVPMPRLVPGEVLVQVLAAGINNTEINTRLGWYSQGGWSMPTPFPFIQGTDCCGRVVAAAPGESDAMVGRRVLVRPCTRPHGFSSPDTIWMGCDFDGAFAQFVAVRATEVFAVDCGWSDVELGSIPCASGTAENMVHRVAVTVGDHVLVAGASGGVGGHQGGWGLLHRCADGSTRPGHGAGRGACPRQCSRRLVLHPARHPRQHADGCRDRRRIQEMTMRGPAALAVPPCTLSQTRAASSA